MIHIVLWFSCCHVFQKLAGEWGTVFRRHLQHDQVAVPSVQVLPREAGIAWPFCQLVNSLFMAGPALRRRVRISLNESPLGCRRLGLLHDMVNSCANSRRPSLVSGEYCPGPKTMNPRR